MFSSIVQNNIRQTVALQKFESVRDISIALNKEAYKQDFLEESQADIQQRANMFVESFAHENGMQTSTVQPHNWSFSIEDQKLFDDGLVELITNTNNHLLFGYVDVSGAKITDPLTKTNVSNKNIEPEVDFKVGNIHAHEAWLMKLNQQLIDWSIELKQLRDHEKDEVHQRLSSLKLHLERIKRNSNEVTPDLIQETEQQWKAFHAALEKKIKHS
jgi:hypothetical protein